MRQARRRGKFLSVYDAAAKARCAVKYAVKSGRLKRTPCELCGNPKVQAHHADYGKPLEVRWLCRVHWRRAS